MRIEKTGAGPILSKKKKKRNYQREKMALVPGTSMNISKQWFFCTSQLASPTWLTAGSACIWGTLSFATATNGSSPGMQAAGGQSRAVPSQAGVFLQLSTEHTDALPASKLQADLKECDSKGSVTLSLMLFLEVVSQATPLCSIIERTESCCVYCVYSPGLLWSNQPHKGYNNCAVPSGSMVRNFPPWL